MDEHPDYDWAKHYAAADTPWDLGGPHPELSQGLSDGALAPPRAGARALVPGCGHGHDALALAKRGWRVTAVDLVPELAATLGRELARREGEFLCADVLASRAPSEAAVGIGPPFDPSCLDPGRFDLGRFDLGRFDLVWDHTFFCALHPDRRAAWGARAGALVAPSGRYVALVFPTGKPAEDGGPPFGMSTEAVAAALGAPFELALDRPVARAVPRRTWPERIAVFRRLG